MTDMPQLLLAHHLKALRLPTFLREYDKVARQCSSEGQSQRNKGPCRGLKWVH
jgi:hypothetical protein